MSDILISIPKVDEKEVTKVERGDIGDFKEEIKNKFEKIDNVIFSVITVVIISLVAVIIAVVGLFLDQMHYNNAAYREYTNELKIQNQQFNDQYFQKSCPFFRTQK